MLPVGAATAAGNVAIVTALSTPAQAGGKIDTVIVETAADRGGLLRHVSRDLDVRQHEPSRLRRPGAFGDRCYLKGTDSATADYYGLQTPTGGPYETKG